MRWNLQRKTLDSKYGKKKTWSEKFESSRKKITARYLKKCLGKMQFTKDNFFSKQKWALQNLWDSGIHFTGPSSEHRLVCKNKQSCTPRVTVYMAHFIKRLFFLTQKICPQRFNFCFGLTNLLDERELRYYNLNNLV